MEGGGVALACAHTRIFLRVFFALPLTSPRCHPPYKTPKPKKLGQNPAEIAATYTRETLFAMPVIRK